ncbi:hypothetical protein GCM10010387_19580 [Streptomyces inusitatus]|uniref:Uncharacterized protein n=1 Tax=Streptomyces inusitatus TaxID=68221 RepID=A0A918UQC0_9ACTN|nr:hypothetical protein GCM10010387_19580 [Streptomyces inusitatus]
MRTGRPPDWREAGFADFADFAGGRPEGLVEAEAEAEAEGDAGVVRSREDEGKEGDIGDGVALRRAVAEGRGPSFGCTTIVGPRSSGLPGPSAQPWPASSPAPARAHTIVTATWDFLGVMRRVCFLNRTVD